MTEWFKHKTEKFIGRILVIFEIQREVEWLSVGEREPGSLQISASGLAENLVFVI